MKIKFVTRKRQKNVVLIHKLDTAEKIFILCKEANQLKKNCIFSRNKHKKINNFFNYKNETVLLDKHESTTTKRFLYCCDSPVF